MDTVNEWVGLAVGVIGVLAGVAALLRWTVSQLDSRIDAKLSAGLNPINRRLDALDVKIDRVEERVDHVAVVVDLRLRPIEADMALVKQRLLGTPAA